MYAVPQPGRLAGNSRSKPRPFGPADLSGVLGKRGLHLVLAESLRVPGKLGLDVRPNP